MKNGHNAKILYLTEQSEAGVNEDWQLLENKPEQQSKLLMFTA